MIDSSTTAMIGQIQICFFRNSPVREIERPTLDLAHVMCGPAGRLRRLRFAKDGQADSSQDRPQKAAARRQHTAKPTSIVRPERGRMAKNGENCGQDI